MSVWTREMDGKTIINRSGETTINRSDGIMMGKLWRVPGFDVEDDGGTNVEGRALMIKRKGVKGRGMA